MGQSLISNLYANEHSGMNEKPFRVVLVGCGGISRTWLRATAVFPDLAYVGFVDLDIAQAQRLRAEFGLEGAAVGTDLADMLRQTSANIVFDCTVPEAHAAVTHTALAHGCHVLGEKPLADTMPNAQAMVAAAQASGQLYAVIQNRRYLDDIVRFRTLVQSGELGQLTMLNADFYLGPHFGGFREEMAHVLLLDMAIHTFDQARYICGADPVAVYCHEWNPAGSWYAHGAAAVAIFEMSNGVVFTYRGAWCAEGMNTSWECDWRAVGTGGTAVWDGGPTLHAEKPVGRDGFIRPIQPITPPPLQKLTHTGHAGVIADFLAALRGGSTPQTICTDNIHSLAMVHAAIHSAKNGRRVFLEEVTSNQSH